MNIKKKIKSKEVVVFHPSNEGAGVEKNLYLITNYLSQKLKKVSLITCDEKKNKFSKKVNIIRPFLNINENSGRPIKYFLCILYLTIYCILRNNKFVVLSFQANIYVIIICKIFNVRIISRSNSSPSGWSKNFLKNIIFNFFLKRADEIIVNSIDFKNELDKKFNLKSILILNPFNFKEIKRKSKEKFKFSFFKKNYLRVLNVARLTDQKDHLTLLKAINLAKKSRKIQLVIIGKGVFKNRLLDYIDKNDLSRFVKLVNYQENPFKFMRLCDVFVLSSIFEGHPNVLVEALSLKKYVISSDCPTGPKEILGNGKYGSLFKLQDYKQLAKILINFKLNSSAKKKISDGLKTIKIYDHNDKCEAYLKVLKKYI
tara:strand:+ start:282 stop:1394 length:1113 start_codon:yes stop_codon:yes gene_type:complete